MTESAGRMAHATCAVRPAIRAIVVAVVGPASAAVAAVAIAIAEVVTVIDEGVIS